MTYDESVQQFINYHSNHSTDHMHIDCLHKNKKTLHFTLTVFSPAPFDSYKKQRFLPHTAFCGWSF